MGTQNRDVEALRFCLLAVMNKNSNNDISYNFYNGQIFHTFKSCVKSIFAGLASFNRAENFRMVDIGIKA